MAEGTEENTILVFHLLDNNIFQVKNVGGESHLPRKGPDNIYHIEGRLTVASKDNVKEMFAAIMPIIKAGGDSRKIILGPLSRYWRGPCCENSAHHLNYNEKSYLGDLGNSVFRVRDHLREAAYNKRVRRFRVLCPNRFIGMGERSDDPSLDELRVTATRWGADPVHPGEDAYVMMADGLSAEMEKSPTIYTNSGSSQAGPPGKRQRVDQADRRQSWVSGCNATLPRTDSRIERGRGGARPRFGTWNRGGYSARGKRGGSYAARGRGAPSSRGRGSIRGRGNRDGGTTSGFRQTHFSY
jgi:hypothetical protein